MVGAGYWPASVSDARRRRWQRRAKRQPDGNYKHGRYTAEMVATRRWLRETARMLRGLNGEADRA
jgi:hypothetical protein